MTACQKVLLKGRLLGVKDLGTVLDSVVVSDVLVWPTLISHTSLDSFIGIRTGHRHIAYEWPDSWQSIICD